MAKKKEGGLAVVIGVGKTKPKGGPPPDDTGGDNLAEATSPQDDYLAENAGQEPPPPDQGEGEGAYPEFTIPAGLDLSDMEPGEEKQVLCLIGKTADDTACIKQVDGVDLAGEGQGMYGPPPAAPVPSPPPPGLMGPPPPGMLAGGPPMGPPPGGPIRGRAAARGLI
jgi:hypothetical protein